MTRLSVIIVSYNVRAFLQQTLVAAQRALDGIEGEIFVVDNHSSDDSTLMVAKEFPNVKLISNETNLGFAKANNQAIQQASGEFILLLNPDTIVAEDTFSKCIAFMDDHKDAGAVGVKMIDGSGNFLPESKRSFPSPAVAFWKIFGFARLFPRSKIFGRYHLGYLPENETNPVDVLSGAFMFIRTDALKTAGFLDESFFMYGEDIDLSYRLVQAGYKNYYFAGTTIIHFKGESTKKGSLNYVRMFYHAMIVFAKKHSERNASAFIFLIQLAIYLRAFFALSARFVRLISFPLLDALTIFGSMFLLKNFWETNVKSAENIHYPEFYMQVMVPSYILVWLVSAYFSGGYDKPLRLVRIVRGMLVGTIIILAGYGLLNESFRFSRALILFGGLFSTFVICTMRILLNTISDKKFLASNPILEKLAFAGNKNAPKAMAVYKNNHPSDKIAGVISVNDDPAENSLGRIEQLSEILKTYRIHELIFCSPDISFRKIIAVMNERKSEIAFRIFLFENNLILGSDSKNFSGEIITAVQYNLENATQRRFKRAFDFLFAAIALLLSPLLICFVQNRSGFLKNLFLVLTGRATWVGFHHSEQLMNKFKFIPKAILSVAENLPTDLRNRETYERLEFFYSRDYSVADDFRIVFSNLRLIGNPPC